MLNIENLKCGFGKHEILHGISLTIPKGQITAIVGQSGCGKTTFLKTLNRMVEEEGGYLSGTITLEGTDIKSLPKEKLRRRVGMVFQQPIAFPHSIEKNLSYVLKYHGVRNKKEIAEKITESLQKAKLYDEVKDQLKKSALKLSGGQKQRLAIARSLCAGPDILLLGDVGHETELFLGEDGAGRVAGVRDHDGARALVDERFDLLAVSVAIPLLRAGRDRANRCTAGAGHRVVVGVERLGNENFVAVVKNALQRDLKRFAAAGGDVDLALVEVHVELVIVVPDRVDQLGDAGRGRVGQHRLLEVTDRLEKRGRSLYVRLADVEVIDVDAACLRRHCVRVELAHRRQAAFFNFAGKFHVVLLLFYYDDRRSSAGHIQYTYYICPMLVI